MLENNVHTLEYGIPVSCYGDSEGTGVIVKCDGQPIAISPVAKSLFCIISFSPKFRVASPCSAYLKNSCPAPVNFTPSFSR